MAHLEYNNSVWAPYKRCDIEKLEKVQKRATKMLPSLRKMPYPERLKKLGLPTLIYRRSRGDVIETYKLLSGKYDSQVALKIPLYLSDDHHTRGNSRKLLVKRCHYNLRKYFFSNHIINIWNSLPDSIVMVDTVNQFKNRLDKYWKNCDFVYDHRATYTGTGGRFCV